MCIFLHECRKLLGRQILWMIAVCLLLANGCLVFLKTTGQSDLSPSIYQMFFAEMADMTPTEAVTWIDAELENNLSGGALRYSTPFLLTVQEEAIAVSGYTEYLHMISAQKTAMSMLFSDPNTFSYRNIQKTPPAYQNVQNIEPTFDVSQGIVLALNSPVTDIIGIFLVFFFTVNLLVWDRENGCIRLLFSFRNGRAALFTAQLLVSATVSIMIALCFFGENLIIGSMTYGLGDLSRPIQSVYGWLSCNLPISTAEYLLLFLAGKALSYTFLSVLFSMICCISRNNLMVYGISGCIIGISFLLYHFIPETSPLSLLHYWNPVLFSQTNEIFAGYKNVNLFGYPVSLKISAVILLMSGIGILATVGTFAFVRLKNKDYRVYSIPLPKIPNVAHSRWFYTLYKSIILRKGFILVLALIVAVVGMWRGFSHPYSNDEIYYYNYTTALQGQNFDAAEQFVEEKLHYYAELEQLIAEEIQKETPNQFQIQLWSNEMNDRAAVLRIQNRLNAMTDNNVNSGIFYDTGYERLLGLDGGSMDILYLVLLTMFMALLLSPQMVSDRNLRKVIYSTQSGRRLYWMDNLLYGFLIGCFGAILLTVPYAVKIMSSYGTQGLDYPIQSIGETANLKLSVTVLGFLILMLVWRMIAAAVCSSLMLILSALCRNTMTAIMINLALFTLPAVLYFTGLNQLANMGVTAFLSGLRLFVL